MKYTRIGIAVVTLCLLLSSAINRTYADGSDPQHMQLLEIPAIDVRLNITNAQFTGNDWDFSQITTEAAYLDGLPHPGDGKNTVIGAHYELKGRTPGPFYRLSEVKIGDSVMVTVDDVHYTYKVTKIWTVKPTDTHPLYGIRLETLTLITCADYVDGTYATRLVVRATLVSRNS
jgi:LPXTG-site transpeptidase (sortase) family protein